jgi:hypothetical protein
MKNTFAVASALALFAAPLAAETVPLNTVSGGAGSEQVAGQAEAGAIALGGTTAVTTGLVVATAVVTVAVAAEESSSTN